MNKHCQRKEIRLKELSMSHFNESTAEKKIKHFQNLSAKQTV